jgi:DNA-binding response OmpR family regulator
MHVSSLRRKLAEHGEDPNRIVTLRGYGYRYDPPGRVSASN